jgi:hypothetical protein
MQVPSTPSTEQVGAGAPLLLDELPPDDELEELLVDDEPDELLLADELDDELLLEDELLLDDDEVDELLAGVQHSMSAAPGQKPAVDL